MNCDKQKALDQDIYTVTFNKEIDHNTFGFNLDQNYGEDCAISDLKNIFYLNIQYAEDCKYAAYCASDSNPENVKKYVKVVSNTGEYSYTLCANNATAITYGYALPGYSDPKIKAGDYKVTFFQCDSLECNNQKMIGQDLIKISHDGTPDHPKFNFTFDPDFGENCETFLIK